MRKLLDYIQQNLVELDYWRTYAGIKEPTLEELGSLQVLIQLAIQEKVQEILCS